MGIKFVLAALMLGTVNAKHGNKFYLPLVQMESDSNEETGSEGNFNMKEYIDEVLVNMSSHFGRKYELNGTGLATKEDILKMKSELNGKIDNISAVITEQLKPKPIDCGDIRNDGYNTTGIYTIFPKHRTSSLLVRCDMDTSYGGWIVIQRRVSDSDFYKTWSEYEAGFGNLRGNFWLGLRNIYLITQQAKYELRVDLSSMNGETAYAYYDEFSVGAAESDYKLNVGGYSGTAGDSLIRQNGMKFSTYDQDNDIDSGNCAVQYHGAWWYEKCHSSNLNGDYGNTDFGEGPVWYHWKGYYVPLKTTEMKIRRVG